MTKLQKKFASGIALFALLFAQTPMVFAGEIVLEVVGNGSNSDNDIDIDLDRKTEVFQTNDTTIVNDISVQSNTGHNNADDNTGGSVDIDTGNSEISAHVSNQANSNVAVLDGCNCDQDIDVLIHGNGTRSDNKVDIDNDHKTSLIQDNAANIVNALDLRGNTGHNDADDNTGGSVSIRTGDAQIAPVHILNQANSNVAFLGGSGHGSSLDVEVVGNGSNSDNDVDVDSDTETEFFQFNDTYILNDLYFKANTGYNGADDNTFWSGHVDIDTGDAVVEAFIANAAGFNAASADCGCVMDVFGLLEHNGTDSDNKIDLDLDDKLEAVQDNVDDLINTGDVKGNTGDNDADDNTGGHVDVRTGHSETVISSDNQGGSNVFGDIEVEFPFGSFFFGL